MKIFCFVWNLQSIRISESVQRSEKEPISFLSEHWFHCHEPDFLPSLMEKIFSEDYDILVFSVQESAKPGDYLLSHAIPRELGNRYILLGRQRMTGIGKVSYTSLKRNWEMKLRGVRIAVFAKADFVPKVQVVGDTWNACPGRDKVTLGKGSVAIILNIQGIGTVAFVNMHLPFDVCTITGSNCTRIQKGVAQQNQAFNSLLEDVSHQYPSIHYWFVMGDFNYRILHRDNIVDARQIHATLQDSVESRRKIYETSDELKSSIDYGAIPPFEEGIDGKGPGFMPTAKMAHERIPGSCRIESYVVGEQYHLNPSWCDRVLYGSLSQLQQLESREDCRDEGFIPIKCLLYDRFEEGKTMTLSDHSAVIAAFEL